MKLKTLSDKRDWGGIYPEKAIKEFIKETLKDAGRTFNYSLKKCDFMDRLRKRAGEGLLK
jgi:hypothetical protein